MKHGLAHVHTLIFYLVLPCWSLASHAAISYWRDRGFSRLSHVIPALPDFLHAKTASPDIFYFQHAPDSLSHSPLSQSSLGQYPTCHTGQEEITVIRGWGGRQLSQCADWLLWLAAFSKVEDTGLIWGRQWLFKLSGSSSVRRLGAFTVQESMDSGSQMGASQTCSEGSQLPWDPDVFRGVLTLKPFQFTGSSAAKKIPTLQCKNQWAALLSPLTGCKQPCYTSMSLSVRR